ncbi:proteasome subunit alpha type-5 isoform X1 [Oncorhynchus kisutch]|uniref:proteasome subunit alpha type-5 isoform X1 n=1 Tax=Oncorhynchus kisutch TaxID=8019 RepID=UPI0012DC7973|nr:proteasome subunit alpha type-5 isoform X1 [Oncorhynchus kisutch]
MFLTRSEYDRGVNTFSPEGRLFQVEYAIEAIKLGSTAIGIQTSEGVCLAVEKRITSPLMEPSSIEKIVEIDTHIGCAMSGLIADAKTLIDKARVETQNHWFTYNETMTVESVTQAVSNLALQFGEEDADPGAMSRPFGVALLFGGLDEKGPQLYHMDPSGTFVQCDARAIGSASEGAQSSLQEVYHKVPPPLSRASSPFPLLLSLLSSANLLLHYPPTFSFITSSITRQPSPSLLPPSPANLLLHYFLHHPPQLHQIVSWFHSPSYYRGDNLILFINQDLCFLSGWPLQSMTLKEAIKSSLTILKQVMEEKLNATNIELATIEPGKTFHMYSKEELEDVIKDI